MYPIFDFLKSIILKSIKNWYFFRKNDSTNVNT